MRAEAYYQYGAERTLSDRVADFCYWRTTSNETRGRNGGGESEAWPFCERLLSTTPATLEARPK